MNFIKLQYKDFTSCIFTLFNYLDSLPKLYYFLFKWKFDNSQFWIQHTQNMKITEVGTFTKKCTHISFLGFFFQYFVLTIIMKHHKDNKISTFWPRCSVVCLNPYLFLFVVHVHYQISEIHPRSFGDCSQKYSEHCKAWNYQNRWCFADTSPILRRRFADASQIKNIGECSAKHLWSLAEHFSRLNIANGSGKFQCKHWKFWTSGRGFAMLPHEYHEFHDNPQCFGYTSWTSPDACQFPSGMHRRG